MRPPESAPHWLLVEGPDDKWSVINLLMRHGVDWDSWTEGNPMVPFVNDCGGITEVISSLTASLKTYHRLGILIDANETPADRWVSLKYQAGSVGVELPEMPQPGGVIVDGTQSDWKVGIWMMPDNSQSGQLEDFLSTLVPDGDPCWEYSGEATNKAKELGAEFRDRDQVKAQIHTWLAWQEEPGKPFGTAITAAYFNHDSAEALRFVDWFKRLFLN